MTSFLIYSLQAGAALAVLYAVYALFLKRETFFQLNRLYLVSGLLLAFLIPAFPVTSPFKAPAAALNLDLSAPLSSAARAFDPAGLLALVYWAGVSLFLFRFSLQLAKLSRIVRRNGIRRVRGAKLVSVDRTFPPFSFLDIIFINEDLAAETNLRRILAHEEVHIRQLHTLDVLLMEIVVSLQWFNPFVWPYKKALQATHEYLADSGVIAQGFSSVKYELLMFEQQVGASLFELGSNFRCSQIKRRIMMLSKAKSPKTAKLKLLLAVPIIFALVLVFAEPRAAATAMQTAGQDKTLKAADEQAAQKLIKVKEEIQKLIAMEQELHVKIEAAQDEATRDELRKKLEKVIEKRKEIEALHAGSVGVLVIPDSIEELEKGLVKLQAKEKDIREKLKVTTDPKQKTDLENMLHKTQQMQKAYEEKLMKTRAGKTAK